MVDAFVNPRKREKFEVAAGAINTLHQLRNRAITITAMQLNFSDEPANEDFTLQLLDPDQDVVRSDVFNPKDYDTNYVTRTFLNWTSNHDGGYIKLVYANSDDHLAQIIVDYTVDQD